MVAVLLVGDSVEEILASDCDDDRGTRMTDILPLLSFLLWGAKVREGFIDCKGRGMLLLKECRFLLLLPLFFDGNNERVVQKEKQSKDG